MPRRPYCRDDLCFQVTPEGAKCEAHNVQVRNPFCVLEDCPNFRIGTSKYCTKHHQRLYRLGGTDDSLLTVRTTPPPIEIVDGIGYVSLTQGHFAIVDEADIPLISDVIWCVKTNGKRKYAEYNTLGTFVSMHRRILVPDGPGTVQVDHINYNGLDNRRSNLRLSTAQQNSWNREETKSSSGYRGVSKEGAGWKVQFVVSPQEDLYLGIYETPEEAARVWDAKCLEVRGLEWAVLNFPLQINP